jgi:DNA-binding response OmpR family regulator
MLNSKEILLHTKDLNILFVEDHEDLRVNTAQILSRFFKTVDVSEDGAQALSLFKENTSKYDIIMSDIQMPKMNGIELTKNIYSIKPEQTIIILSAYDDSKYLYELVNLKIEHFLKKPIDYQELLHALYNAAKHIKKTSNSSTTRASENIKLSKTYSFNRDNNLLYNGAELITLTKFEMIFMQLLTEHVGKIYSNEDITAHFASLNETLDASNIRKLVSKLRKKLPSNTIESLYGVGYRIVPFM